MALISNNIRSSTITTSIMSIQTRSMTRKAKASNIPTTNMSREKATMNLRPSNLKPDVLAYDPTYAFIYNHSSISFREMPEKDVLMRGLSSLTTDNVSKYIFASNCYLAYIHKKNRDVLSFWNHIDNDPQEKGRNSIRVKLDKMNRDILIEYPSLVFDEMEEGDILKCVMTKYAWYSIHIEKKKNEYIFSFHTSYGTLQ